MAKDALERLFEDAVSSSEQSQYSLEDQLNFEDDDFITSMSDQAKDAMSTRIQKIELDEDEIETDEFEVNDNETILNDDSIESEVIEEEPVKRGRGRPRKNPLPEESEEENKEENKEVKEKQNIKIDSMDEFMESLALDLIEELKTSNYKTRNFSKNQMLVILNYMEKYFK